MDHTGVKRNWTRILRCIGVAALGSLLAGIAASSLRKSGGYRRLASFQTATIIYDSIAGTIPIE
jgi:hypothetical protein